MNTGFRCECCGRRISLSFQEGITDTRCPYCGKRAKLPASLAALPHPRVDDDVVEGRPVDQAEPVGACALADHDAAGEAVIMRTMPWILSVLLHLGLAVIMMFLALLAMPQKAKEPTHVVKLLDISSDPEAMRVVFDRRGKLKDRLKLDPMKPKGGRTWQQPTPLKAPKVDNTGPGPKVDLEGRDDRADVTLTDWRGRGTGRGIFDGDGEGPGRGGGGDPPVAPADHVVFVIDRSGSMVGDFDTVRLAMYMRVAEMRPDQKFHAILYAAGTVEENPPRRLVPAVEDEKVAFVEFLDKVLPRDRTDPVPALHRAFTVMRGARLAHKGPKAPKQLIHLLSDGEFPENDKVLEAIRKSNPNGRRQVHINTILYGTRPPEAVKVMKLIAEENKGRYKYVSPDE